MKHVAPRPQQDVMSSEWQLSHKRMWLICVYLCLVSFSLSQPWDKTLAKQYLLKTQQDASHKENNTFFLIKYSILHIKTNT